MLTRNVLIKYRIIKERNESMKLFAALNMEFTFQYTQEIKMLSCFYL